MTTWRRIRSPKEISVSLEKTTKHFLRRWESSRPQWEPLALKRENMQQWWTFPGVAGQAKFIQVTKPTTISETLQASPSPAKSNVHNSEIRKRLGEMAAVALGGRWLFVCRSIWKAFWNQIEKYFKTASCVYLDYLCLILQCDWSSETCVTEKKKKSICNWNHMCSSSFLYYQSKHTWKRQIIIFCYSFLKVNDWQQLITASGLGRPCFFFL